MVTEAGGFVCDFEGKELGQKEFKFSSQTEVILGSTKDIAYEIVERIKNLK